MNKENILNNISVLVAVFVILLCKDAGLSVWVSMLCSMGVGLSVIGSYSLVKVMWKRRPWKS